MAFWSQNSSYEPLREYLWTIDFLVDSTEQDRVRLSLKECSKPEFEVSFTEHKLLTQTFKYPGLLKWKPIQVKLASTLDEKATLDRVLESVMRVGGYSSPTDYEIKKDSSEALAKTDEAYISTVGVGNKKRVIEVTWDKSYKLDELQDTSGNHQQISKEKSSTEAIIRQYNHDGLQIQSWSLYNCFISSVSYGKLSYSSEDIVEISITLQYDWALEREVDYYNEIERMYNEREVELEAQKALESQEARARLEIFKETIKEQEDSKLAEQKKLEEYRKANFPDLEESRDPWVEKSVIKPKSEQDTADVAAILESDKTYNDKPGEGKKVVDKSAESVKLAETSEEKTKEARSAAIESVLNNSQTPPTVDSAQNSPSDEVKYFSEPVPTEDNDLTAQENNIPPTSQESLPEPEQIQDTNGRVKASTDMQASSEEYEDSEDVMSIASESNKPGDTVTPETSKEPVPETRPDVDAAAVEALNKKVGNSVLKTVESQKGKTRGDRMVEVLEEQYSQREQKRVQAEIEAATAAEANIQKATEPPPSDQNATSGQTTGNSEVPSSTPPAVQEEKPESKTVSQPEQVTNARMALLNRAGEIARDQKVSNRQALEQAEKEMGFDPYKITGENPDASTNTAQRPANKREDELLNQYSNSTRVQNPNSANSNNTTTSSTATQRTASESPSRSSQSVQVGSQTESIGEGGFARAVKETGANPTAQKTDLNDTSYERQSGETVYVPKETARKAIEYATEERKRGSERERKKIFDTPAGADDPFKDRRSGVMDRAKRGFGR